LNHSHICSDLITVNLQADGGWGDTFIAVLEEISASGACLRTEHPIPTGAKIRLICSNCAAACEFLAEVVACDRNEESGYFSKVVFEPETLWSPERYRPQYLVDLSAMAEFAERNSPRAGDCCCEGGVCRNEPASPLIEPFVPLAERVRHVGREAAKVCGTMSPPEAAECFSRLFQSPPKCRFFHQFLVGYHCESGQLSFTKPR
jgi:hypothetical protein